MSEEKQRSTELFDAVTTENSHRAQMLAVLDFEATADKNLVRKEEAIREELAISPIRYYQLLNYALELPEANEKYPMLVAQLRRRRDIRDNQRRESHKY